MKLYALSFIISVRIWNDLNCEKVAILDLYVGRFASNDGPISGPHARSFRDFENRATRSIVLAHLLEIQAAHTKFPCRIWVISKF